MGKPTAVPLPLHKSYKSALVIVPECDALDTIEQIRKLHDRRYYRWMPHITMIFPFVAVDGPAETRENTIKIVRDIVYAKKQLSISFACFNSFTHSRNSHTLYLRPDSGSEIALQSLVDQLAKALPDFDDVRRDGHFSPHLSLGQFRSKQAMQEVEVEYEALPCSVTFQAYSMAWVTREGFKDRMKIREHFLLSTSMDTIEHHASCIPPDQSPQSANLERSVAL